MPNGCLKYEEVLARYVHGEILRHEREGLESHLAGCGACSARYREAVEVDRFLRSLPPVDVEPPPWLHARIMAHLPEASAVPWSARLGRWAWPVATASAGALLAVLVMRVVQPTAPLRTAAVAPPLASASRPEPVRATPPPAPAVVAAVKPAPAPQALQAVSPVAVASAGLVAPAVHEVKIYLYAPSAQRVAVTGDFNGWDAKGVDLKPAGRPGLWETDLQLPPGAYAYNFIVDDDVLVPDPDAPNQMPDGFGGTNSIMLVKDGARS